MVTILLIGSHSSEFPPHLTFASPTWSEGLLSLGKGCRIRLPGDSSTNTGRNGLKFVKSER